MAEVTFSDSAPIPKFLNPAPAIPQIWESDSCSDSGYNHPSNRNLPMFLPTKLRTDSCYCRNGKVTPGPVFHKFLTPSPDPGPKEKRRILPESTPVIRIRYHLWFEHQWFTDMEILQSWSNPKLFHRLHTQSISEKIKLWTLISNPKPLNQLHISQYNWYCLFCLMRQKLWLFCLLSDKSCWSGHMTSRLRYTKDKS